MSRPELACEVHQYIPSIDGDACPQCAEERKRKERTAMVQSLRQFADFLEVTPTAKCPGYLNIMIAVQDKATMIDAVRAMGSAQKEFEGNYFSVSRQFGPIKYEVFIDRAKVCEKTVIGKRIVPEREEEIVEWACHDSLFATESTKGSEEK